MSPRVSEKYKDEKKKTLLSFSRNVFVKKGYLKTSMQDIMDEAKISRGALYSYFKNIDEIFIEVLKIDDSKDLSALEFDENKSIWNQLNAWIEDILEDICNIEDTLTLAKSEFFVSLNYKNQKENLSYIIDRHSVLEKRIEKIIQMGIDRGEFNPKVSLNSIAIYFISFFDGLMLNKFNLNMDRIQLEDQIEIFKYSTKVILCLDNNKNQ